MEQHKELASGKWHKMTISEQLGNTGSEYERAIKWQHDENVDRFNLAFRRFLELLDLTINDPRWSVFRKKELLRVREVCCGVFLNKLDSKGLDKYFYKFALLARNTK